MISVQDSSLFHLFAWQRLLAWCQHSPTGTCCDESMGRPLGTFIVAFLMPSGTTVVGSQMHICAVPKGSDQFEPRNNMMGIMLH